MSSPTVHVLEHLQNLWGPPVRTAEFRRGSNATQVLKWGERQTRDGVTIYVTVGVSDHPIGAQSPGHRTELFIGFSPEEDRIAVALSMAALGNDPSNPQLLHGHTVTFPEPLWGGAGMSTLLFVYPRDSIIPDLTADQLHVRFLQAIPIFPSELAYKQANSAEQLLALWEAHALPFWDPRREAMSPNWAA